MTIPNQVQNVAKGNVVTGDLKYDLVICQAGSKFEHADECVKGGPDDDALSFADCIF